MSESARKESFMSSPETPEAQRAQQIKTLEGLIGLSTVLTAINSDTVRTALWAGAEALRQQQAERSSPSGLAELTVASYLLHEDPHGMNTEAVRMRQRDGRILWAVRHGSKCLNQSGEWEYEPQPSSRDDAFFARCRFASTADAIEAYHARGSALLSGEKET